MRRKLKTSKIPELELEAFDGSISTFSEYYEFIEALGYGGFSFVVLAEDKKLGKKVAVKVRI